MFSLIGNVLVLNLHYRNNRMGGKMPKWVFFLWLIFPNI